MPKELRRAPETLSVWESNIKEIEIRQPNLAVLLKNYTILQGHDFSHFENQTPAGKWIEGLTDEPFFERGGEPKFNWSRANREDRNKPVFILYGIGTPPYLFKAIKALPEGALSLIVVEPNVSLIAYTLHLTHVFLALPERCGLTFLTEGRGIGNTEEEIRDSRFIHSHALADECLSLALKPVGIFSAALAVASWHDGESDSWREAFKRLGESIREWVTLTLAYLGNSAEDTLLGFRQIALMSPMIAFGKPLELIKNKFPDRPAILVAAGPSLDKNFMQLKAVQDKCLIIAADAILSKLLRNGIKPHIVTSLERVVVTYDFFFSSTVEEFREECSDILLVAQSLCVPWTSGRWPGPVCLVHKEEVVVDTWFAGGVLGGSKIISGVSVAHMNYALANYVNSPFIGIIGQDLAYGEDGSSHAGSVTGSSKGDRPGAMEIPGALGGRVKTSETWFSFLRLLEDIIIEYKRPTWNCTEGGAMITRTRVEPLSDFIDRFAANLVPMKLTPASIVREGCNDLDTKAVGERVKAEIAKQYHEFDVVYKDLDEVERLMGSAVAAGLEPARRIAYAAQAGHVLDTIHGRSAVFDFIGQSYTRLATIELALTRNMEDVATVERWYAMHKEILDSHRAIMVFINKWVAYTERAISYWTDKGAFPWGPLDAEEAWDRASNLLERLRDAEGDEIADIKLELTNVMMRCDPVRLKWPGRTLWNYAMLLMTEGRAALATRFMNAAAADFEGREMPTEEMAAFFKDYARVLMGTDLTHNPSHFKAEMMLANAADLIGPDDEIREILSELLDTEVAHSAMMDEFRGGGSRGEANWFADRAAAQRLLYEGDLKRALASVWSAITKHWRLVPGWAASHLDWLATTMEKCLGSGDPLLEETVDAILSEMAQNGELIRNVPINYSLRFVGLLQSKGLKVAVIDRTREAAAANAERADLKPQAKA